MKLLHPNSSGAENKKDINHIINIMNRLFWMCIFLQREKVLILRYNGLHLLRQVL